MRRSLHPYAIAITSIALIFGVIPAANASPPCYAVEGTKVIGHGTCTGAVVIEPGITEIGVEAFAETNITSVDIPASVTTIAELAFWRANLLSEVTFREGLITIGESAFAETALTSIVIPNSVTFLGQSAFYGNLQATNLVIGTGISEIQNDTFVSIQATTITIPSNVKSIGARAFLDADKVVTLTLSEGLEVIDEDAFAGTFALVNMTIPSTVYSISTFTSYDEAYVYLSLIHI
jgi:hypothetical protein